MKAPAAFALPVGSLNLVLLTNQIATKWGISPAPLHPPLLLASFPCSQQQPSYAPMPYVNSSLQVRCSGRGKHDSTEADVIPGGGGGGVCLTSSKPSQVQTPVAAHNQQIAWSKSKYKYTG